MNVKNINIKIFKKKVCVSLINLKKEMLSEIIANIKKIKT